MAVTTSKVTYSLKPQTVDRVAELAELWGVPKSEVIRRAIEQIDAASGAMAKPETPYEIFRRLQRTSTLTKKQADGFMHEVRAERRASGVSRT